MKNLTLWVYSVSLVVTLLVFSTYDSAPSPRIEATSNVWKVAHEVQGRASGVPIAVRDGELWLLTARHVPGDENHTEWTATHRDGASLGEGRVISVHPDEDSAILAFPLEGLEPFIVNLSFEPLELGETVYGAGWGGSAFLWLTTGLVSGLDRTSSQIALGDSGGGLFNEEGELIAILVGRSTYAAHMTWVVPLVDIEEWLKKNLQEPVAAPE